MSDFRGPRVPAARCFPLSFRSPIYGRGDDQEGWSLGRLQGALRIVGEESERAGQDLSVGLVSLRAVDSHSRLYRRAMGSDLIFESLWVSSVKGACGRGLPWWSSG